MVIPQEPEHSCSLGNRAVNSTISGTLNSISAAAIGGGGAIGGGSSSDGQVGISSDGTDGMAYAVSGSNTKINLVLSDAITAAATGGAGGKGAWGSGADSRKGIALTAATECKAAMLMLSECR